MQPPVTRWGKFWLSVLNLHSWNGVNPTPAELWLLPEFLPFHPHRWWIHTRNVYIPMSFIQGKRFQAPLDPLISSLRDVCLPSFRFTFGHPVLILLNESRKFTLNVMTPSIGLLVVTMSPALIFTRLIRVLPIFCLESSTFSTKWPLLLFDRVLCKEPIASS